MKKTVGKSRNKKSIPKKNKTAKCGGAAGFTFGVNITPEGVLLNTNAKGKDYAFDSKMIGMTITSGNYKHDFYSNKRGFVSDKVIIPKEVLEILKDKKIICMSRAPIQYESAKKSFFGTKTFFSEPIIFTFTNLNIGFTSIVNTNNIEIDILWPQDAKLRSQWGLGEIRNKTNIVNKYDKEFWFNFKPFLNINLFDEHNRQDIIRVIQRRRATVPLVNFYPINVNLNEPPGDLENNLSKFSVVYDVNSVNFNMDKMKKYTNSPGIEDAYRRHIDNLERTKTAEINSLKEKLGQLNRELENGISRERASGPRYRDDSQVQEVRREKERAEEQLDSLKGELRKEERALMNLKSEKENLKESLRDLEENKTREKDSIGGIESQKIRLTIEKNELTREKGVLMKEKNELTREKGVLMKEKNRLTRANDELMKEKQDLTREKKRLERSRSENKSDMSSLTTRSGYTSSSSRRTGQSRRYPSPTPTSSIAHHAHDQARLNIA